MREENLTDSQVAQLLGYNFLFHYNEYTKKWNCIHREDYIGYFNNFTTKKNIDNTSKFPITKGVSIKEASLKMLESLTNLKN
jgi:hypothetical protein